MAEAMPEPIIIVKVEDGPYSIDNPPDIGSFSAELLYDLAAGNLNGVVISATGVKFIASNGVFEYVFRAENRHYANNIIGDLVKE